MDSEELSGSLFEKIEGTVELGVDDRVISLILTGKMDESVPTDETDAKGDLDMGADGLPCSQLEVGTSTTDEVTY